MMMSAVYRGLILIIVNDTILLLVEGCMALFNVCVSVWFVQTLEINKIGT